MSKNKSFTEIFALNLVVIFFKCLCPVFFELVSRTEGSNDVASSSKPDTLSHF